VLKLSNLSEYVAPQKYWNTPTFVKKQSTQGIINYVRGFWDAEGGMPKNITGRFQPYLSFDQNNYESLTFVRDFLTQIGYSPTRLTFTGRCWQFRLTRKKEIIRYILEIQTWHPEKKLRQKKLLQFLLP
ncbi:MAG: hypothetical protein NZ931_06490, partial [Aigarchaeota archaeon]|nr:hypothetical protein [Aigarchaeota archaeon]